MALTLRSVSLPMARFGITAIVLAVGLVSGALARPSAEATAIDNIIAPYVARHDFSGAVLVSRGGNIIFDQAYGYADVAGHVENTTSTSFHIGPLSEAYTAVLAMQLVEKGALNLDNTVAQFLPDVPGGDRITIRDLLGASSGTPGPASSYVVLARIVEQRLGTSFGDALNSAIFSPRWMDGAGVDADDLEPAHRYAVGYVRDEAGALHPAARMKWSAVTGEGSVYTTTQDELRFVNALFEGDLLKPETRAMMFDAAKPGTAYGWLKRDDKALGGAVYTMAGQQGGFSAFVLHVPASDTTVILLGNVESQAVTRMGQDIAALASAAP